MMWSLLRFFWRRDFDFLNEDMIGRHIEIILKFLTRDTFSHVLALNLPYSIEKLTKHEDKYAYNYSEKDKFVDFDLFSLFSFNFRLRGRFKFVL